MTNNDDVLNSWKEVASYLGRGVRTVQRWEQELSLPVRRPRGTSRSAVIAFKTELDMWLHQSQTNTPAAALLTTGPVANSAFVNGEHTHRAQLHEQTAALVERMHQLVTSSTGLCERSKLLSERVNHMLTVAASNIEKSSRKNGGGGLPQPSRDGV